MDKDQLVDSAGPRQRLEIVKQAIRLMLDDTPVYRMSELIVQIELHMTATERGRHFFEVRQAIQEMLDCGDLVAITATTGAGKSCQLVGMHGLTFEASSPKPRQPGQEVFVRPSYGQPALLVVPIPDCYWARQIAKGSAICAFKCDAENLVVYYEGNLYGASNLHRFEDRASVAYGRLTQRAPTVAMAMVPAREFVVIGQMTPGHLAIDKPSLLSQWNQEMAD